MMFSHPCLAEIIKTVEYNYYDISPRNVGEIKPELMRRSPIRSGGGSSYNGRTDWYIDWKFQSSVGPNGCQVTGYQTHIRTVYTLPRLSEYVTDPQTIEVFDKFDAALVAHEKNHGEHGLSAAREIDQMIGEAPPQRDCRSLSRMVNGIGESVIKKYAALDDEYDRSTRNGMTEGAVIY